MMIRLRLLGPLELSREGGTDPRPLLAQPKRLAVLAYLAARPAGEFVRRDTLLSVFWPELDQNAARGSLRQTLHVVRSHLGAETITSRGDEDLAINPSRLECDVSQFLAALADRRHAEALDLYRGDLLGGFFLSGGAPEFERWLEQERSRFRVAAVSAATHLATEAERAGGGDATGAAVWARRALGLAPDDEVALRRLLTLLERAGDRAGALRAYDAFTRRLAQDLEEEPSEETKRLVAGLRSRTAAADLVTAAPGPHGATPLLARRRWLVLAAAATVIILGLVGGALWKRPPGIPVLAVGEIRAGNPSANGVALRALPELLATTLAQVGGLSVISHPRLAELAAQLATAGRPASATDAARIAGATELVEGVLYGFPGDSLRLDLRRVDARRGVVRDAFTLRGRDVFALADSAAVGFADRFSLKPPAPSFTQATSASLAAHALYDEGLRTYYGSGDMRAAARLFTAALEQDSTFAMAAYYLGRSLELPDPHGSAEAFGRAARLASHASEREALLIRVQWPAAKNEPGWVRLADSLASRYPREPEGRYNQALARDLVGDYMGAVTAFRDVITMDSLSLTSGKGRCIACDAWYGIVWVEVAADSLTAAAREATAFLRVQPHSGLAWDAWATVLDRQGRLAEALVARDSASRLSSGQGASAIDHAYFAIRAGEYETADRLLETAVQVGPADQRREALWWHIISVRNEGRPHLAVTLARRYLREVPGTSITLGQALFEAGEFAAATQAFNSATAAADTESRTSPGMAARHRAWALTQRANVTAAQSDTAGLRAVADSIAVAARGSAFGRDRLLPAYVRGLLLARQGRLAAAADSFRAAVYSPSEGYTRINVELARTLLALHRPREAIPWLQAALRGGLEASNYYVTRSDIHELLALAFASSGPQDSARAHYAFVARSWAHAEPPFRTRQQSAAAYAKGAPARVASGVGAR